jgi:hypothetical protein
MNEVEKRVCSEANVESSHLDGRPGWRREETVKSSLNLVL